MTGLALPITYDYRVYRGGRYLGSLMPSNPFQYALDINNGSAPMTVEVPVKFSTAAQPPDNIETESGGILQAEDGSNLQTESNALDYGDTNSNTLIATNNDIKVWEFSPDYPNGKLVYSGWMSKYKLQVKAGKALVDCLSYGIDLNDYVLGGAAYVAQINSDTTNNSASVIESDKTSQLLSQTFTPSSSFTLGKLSVKMKVNTTYNPNAQVQCSLMQGSPGAGIVLSTTTVLITNTTAALVDFLFSQALVSGTQYYFQIDVSPVAGVDVSIDTTQPYANGTAWIFSGVAWSIASYDVDFILYSTNGATTAAYSQQDPTVMLRSVVDNYVGQGGRVNYAAGTTVLTGLAVTYTFITQLVLAAIGKILDLSPANYYWTVDPGSQTLYFKPFNTTPDILVQFGKDIDDLELGINAEAIRNALYFTGGPIAGVNLLKYYTNLTSIASIGRTRTAVLVDNRVTVGDTAAAIGNAFLNANAGEIFETTVTLARGGIDITTILPGQSVGFAGAGNFIDGLVLYINRVTRYTDRIDLLLGSIPPRATSMLKQIENDLQDVQTLANPSSPS